jgi:hypothetical protein
MDLDHVFIFVGDLKREPNQLAELGLVETYRRRHHGQGTANACFAFENIFLELLWVADEAELAGPLVERTRLKERSVWRSIGTCPFGVAWRGVDDVVQTWDYCPPYLPDGVAIAVAIDGDDPLQPMMFRSPGDDPPSRWAPSRRGRLQEKAGLTQVTAVEFLHPERLVPSRTLLHLTESATPPFVSMSSDDWGLTLQIADATGDLRCLLWRPAQGFGWAASRR